MLCCRHVMCEIGTEDSLDRRDRCKYNNAYMHIYSGSNSEDLERKRDTLTVIFE